MKVELVNFMCHKNLRIIMGNTINFIVGHNGSMRREKFDNVKIIIFTNLTLFKFVTSIKVERVPY